MLKPTTFKKATLHIPKKDGATWFIIWYNFNPATGRLERIRKTFNLNRIEDISERKEAGKLYCTVINSALANGANVFYTDLKPVAQIVTVAKAIGDALQRHNMQLKKRSAQSYESAANVFLAYLKERDLHTLPVQSIDDTHIYAYIEYRQANGISNTTINNQIGFLHTLFNVMVKRLKHIKANPFESIEALPETETDYFEPLTQDELTRIAHYLKHKDPDFALYTQLIYWAAIRPYHIAQYQAKQIHYADGVIATYGSFSSAQGSK